MTFMDRIVPKATRVRRYQVSFHHSVLKGTMSSEATEVCYLPLKEDIDLEEEETKAILNDTLDTIARQDGLKSLYYGKQIEKPDIMQLVISMSKSRFSTASGRSEPQFTNMEHLAWHSIDKHEAFQQKPEYQPFLERVGTILSGPPEMFHANLLEGSDALDAKVTECISAYFPVDADQAKYSKEGWGKFGDEAAEIPGVQVQGTSFIRVSIYIVHSLQTTGMTGGWSIESHHPEGVESKLFAAFIGWPSVGAHMEFRKTDEFTKFVPLLRGGTKKIMVHHVAFVRHA
jgi:hypothetical protein